MPTYNFKQEAEVYVVSGGTHRIHVTDISFSQTFSEQSYSVNTIHSPTNLFEASVINKANVASFSFSVPALKEADYNVLESLLINATEFDLYIKTAADIYHLDKAVLTNGSFVIERSRPLSLQIAGEAAQLERGVSFTGTLPISNRTYTIPTLDISLNNSPLTDIVSVTMELQNDVSWTGYTTVNKAVAATTMYPSGFTISKKILAGSITQYLTDGNSSTAQTFDTDASLSIKAGNGLSGSFFRGFSFGPAVCSFTNRVNSQSAVYVQSYDWRLVENPSNLAKILKYETD